uniref:Uncharacterized protein n=1 Tax=Cacopsylla melanoneura TaxID=428564 RepID=A0A8D8WGB5_9HEMI
MVGTSLCTGVQVSVQLLENVSQTFRVLLVRVKEHRLEVNRESVAEHRLYEHPQSFNMYPRTEALTKVHLEPPDQRTELFLLIGHQFGYFILTSGQLFLVVHKLTHNEFFVSGMVLKFVLNFLEEGHCVKGKVLVL